MCFPDSAYLIFYVECHNTFLCRVLNIFAFHNSSFVLGCSFVEIIWHFGILLLWFVRWIWSSAQFGINYSLLLKQDSPEYLTNTSWVMNFLVLHVGISTILPDLVRWFLSFCWVFSHIYVRGPLFSWILEGTFCRSLVSSFSAAFSGNLSMKSSCVDFRVPVLIPLTQDVSQSEFQLLSTASLSEKSFKAVSWGQLLSLSCFSSFHCHCPLLPDIQCFRNHLTCVLSVFCLFQAGGEILSLVPHLGQKQSLVTADYNFEKKFLDF